MASGVLSMAGRKQGPLHEIARFTFPRFFFLVLIDIIKNGQAIEYILLGHFPSRILHLHPIIEGGMILPYL